MRTRPDPTRQNPVKSWPDPTRPAGPSDPWTTLVCNTHNDCSLEKNTITLLIIVQIRGLLYFVIYVLILCVYLWNCLCVRLSYKNCRDCFQFYEPENYGQCTNNWYISCCYTPDDRGESVPSPDNKYFWKSQWQSGMRRKHKRMFLLRWTK